MRKWIGLITSVFCILSSAVQADNAPLPLEAEMSQEAPAEDSMEQAPKQVGKAAADSTNTARRSDTAKYVLAASAVAIGITALILVSRHGGRR